MSNEIKRLLDKKLKESMGINYVEKLDDKTIEELKKSTGEGTIIHCFEDDEVYTNAGDVIMPIYSTVEETKRKKLRNTTKVWKTLQNIED